jgi:hypothetical protein
MHLLCRGETVRISLVRFYEDEPVADDICTYAREIKT